MAKSLKERVWWSAYNLTLDCELKNSKVITLAKKAVGLNVIDSDEYQEVLRVSKDKSMSAEDTLDTLRSFIE